MKDDYVIVETTRGIEFGKAVTEPKQVSEHDVVLPLKKVIRLADQKDQLSVEENRLAAEEAHQICKRPIKFVQTKLMNIA